MDEFYIIVKAVLGRPNAKEIPDELLVIFKFWAK